MNRLEGVKSIMSDFDTINKGISEVYNISEEIDERKVKIEKIYESIYKLLEPYSEYMMGTIQGTITNLSIMGGTLFIHYEYNHSGYLNTDYASLPIYFLKMKLEDALAHRNELLELAKVQREKASKEKIRKRDEDEFERLRIKLGKTPYV